MHPLPLVAAAPSGIPIFTAPTPCRLCGGPRSPSPKDGRMRCEVCGDFHCHEPVALIGAIAPAPKGCRCLLCSLPLDDEAADIHFAPGDLEGIGSRLACRRCVEVFQRDPMLPYACLMGQAVPKFHRAATHRREAVAAAQRGDVEAAQVASEACTEALGRARVDAGLAGYLWAMAAEFPTPPVVMRPVRSDTPLGRVEAARLREAECWTRVQDAPGDRDAAEAWTRARDALALATAALVSPQPGEAVSHAR